jgi:predicted HTH domain antitoxin
MATITIEIPDAIAEQYSSLDELRRTMYEDFVIEQRQQGILSLGEAAKLLDMTYAEFFMLLGRKGLSFLNATEEERREHAQHIQRVMEQTAQ